MSEEIMELRVPLFCDRQTAQIVMDKVTGVYTGHVELVTLDGSNELIAEQN